MFPPIVTLPTTSKFPEMLTLLDKLISSLAATMLISPERLDRVLPLSLKLPVSIRVPSMYVVFTPSLNVTPFCETILKLA